VTGKAKWRKIQKDRVLFLLLLRLTSHFAKLGLDVGVVLGRES